MTQIELAKLKVANINYICLLPLNILTRNL
jgi:hypothetical protein